MKKIIASIIAIIIISAVFVSCDFDTTNNFTPEKKPTKQPQKEEVKRNPQGTVAEDDYIANEDGEYIITIPQFWKGKVSYETLGTATYIYHFTHEASEGDVNPYLAIINMSDDKENYDGEAFMEIGEYVFFNVPRFDMPYIEGSEDAAEFAALHEQVPMVLNTLTLISELNEQQNTAQPTEDELEFSDAEPFSALDVYFSDIFIGDDKEEILGKVGQPDSSDEITVQATGEVRDVLKFSFGQLVFAQNKLVVAQITDDTYEGPRGIKVGMELNDIIPKFMCEAEYDDPSMTIFYRDNEGGDTNFAVPPSAVLYKGDMQTLSFAVFTEDSAFDMSADELAEGGYMYVEQYDLVCEFDAQGTMLSFAVRIGAPAE